MIVVFAVGNVADHVILPGLVIGRLRFNLGDHEAGDFSEWW